jgi:hypothetical protein
LEREERGRWREGGREGGRERKGGRSALSDRDRERERERERERNDNMHTHTTHMYILPRISAYFYSVIVSEKLEGGETNYQIF